MSSSNHKAMARAGTGGSLNAACTNMAHTAVGGSIQEIRRKITRTKALKLNKLPSAPAPKFGTVETVAPQK
jgi:hypothetical protein